MAAKQYNIGREGRIFAVAETTFGTEVAHAGTDVIPHKSGASLTHSYPEGEVDERKGTVGVKEFVRNDQHATSFSTGDCYFRPSGSGGTAPDTAALLKALFGTETAGSATTTTVEASPSPTVNGCTVASAAHMAEGQWIAIGTEVALITDITGAAITWAPAMSAAPTAAATVYVGYGYSISALNSESVSIYHETSHTIKGASGLAVNEASFTFPRSGEATCNFSGPGSGRFSFAGTSTLGSGYTSGGSSITVATGDGAKFVHDGVDLYFTVEAEGVNTEESFKFNSVSSDTLSVTGAQKSTSASNHGASAVLRPWSPTPTFVGNPVSGISGYGRLAGTSFSFHDATVKINNGFKMLMSDYGTYYAPGFVRDGNNPLKVNMTITAKFHKDTLKQIGNSYNQTTQTALVVCGNQAGKRWAVYSPKVRVVGDPEIPEGDSAEATISLEFVCMETSGADEIYLGMV